jgi:hypothetical protein
LAGPVSASAEAAWATRLRPWREILNGNFYMRGSRQNAATPQRCFIPSAQPAELEPEYSPVFPVLTFHGSLVRSRDSELTGIRIAIYERLFEPIMAACSPFANR